MKNNHKRPLSSFLPMVEKIREAGYNPIMVSQMALEDTFVFETAQEAEEAYRELELETEGEDSVVGWYYGKANFLKEVNEYQKRFGTKVLYYKL